MDSIPTPPPTRQKKHIFLGLHLQYKNTGALLVVRDRALGEADWTQIPSSPFNSHMSMDTSFYLDLTLRAPRWPWRRDTAGLTNGGGHCVLVCARRK